MSAQWHSAPAWLQLCRTPEWRRVRAPLRAGVLCACLPAQVCDDAACQEKLGQSCMRTLPCGHWFAGLRGDVCPPCLHEGCCPAAPAPPSSSPSTQRQQACGTSCAICWDSLPSAPCIQLGCGHACHLACARARLRAGSPGPSLAFNHLFCALCGSGEARLGSVQVMSSRSDFEHPALAHDLQLALELRWVAFGGWRV